MTIFGTSGNDNLVGSGGMNTFDVSQGGKDFISALGGDDIIIFGAELRASDEIHGGIGADTVQLDGDYSFGLHFAATTMVEVETIELASGNDYKLTMDDANVAAGQTLVIQGGLLAAGKLTVDGSAELDGIFNLVGGADGDELTGGAQNDLFSMVAGGNDHVNGGGGDDTMTFGATLTRFDTIDGGTGTDNRVTIAGDYSAGLHFKNSGFKNVQVLSLLSGTNSYNFTFEDGNVAAFATLTIFGNNLTAGHSLIFDGSRELDGRFSITAGAGDDTLTGSAGSDSFFMGLGGDDFVKGGLGGEFFSYGTSFNKQDHVDGGDGNDQLSMSGDYSGGFKFTTAQIKSIETINLGPGTDYKLQVTDGVVAAGQTLQFVASTLGAGDKVIIKAAAELDGRIAARGGAGDDIFIGSSGNDFLEGGLGKDTMTGGIGSDVFNYENTAAELSGLAHDVIVGFDALAADSFSFKAVVMNFLVSAVDAEITTGRLRAGNFDTDLGTAMAGLAARHAVLFTPSTGGLAGHTFLIVNANEVVGYQSGADLVFEMEGMLNKASLDPTDF